MPRPGSAAAARPAATTSYASASHGRAPIAVIALGDALMGDDGFGPTTLGMLRSHWQWPASVQLLDVSLHGPDLDAHVRGRRQVILLDTVRSDARPGTVVSWGKDALLATGASSGPRLMPWRPRVREAIAGADATDAALEDALLIGVVPYATAVGTTVSPLVEVACRIAAIEVVRRVKGWGADVRGVASARAWWKPAPA